MTDDDTKPQRDPEGWKTGDDPMTEAQRVYLENLANQTGEPTPDEQLSKAEASEKIGELRKEAGIDADDTDGDIEVGDDDRSDAV